MWKWSKWRSALLALVMTAAALPAAAEGPEPAPAGAGADAAVAPAPAATPASAPAVPATTPAPAAESADVRREQLLREIDQAELELRLAKLKSERALLDPPAPAPRQVAVAPPVSAPVPAPVQPPVVRPEPVVVATPPAAVPAPVVRAAKRPAQAAAGKDGRGGTVGYIAQAGELRALVTGGGARLRAVPVDPRRPVVRPGLGVIADPVGGTTGMPLADAGAGASTPAQRIQRVLGGAGSSSGGEDMRGLGLPPPLPGLPARALP